MTGWRCEPIAADEVACGKEKRNSSSAERRRIDVETERCRERRAAQARAQSEGIVARIGYAARDGAEVAGQHVAILFREVRVGVIEAELEYAVGERQAGAPVGKVRQRKPAACRAHAAAARGGAEQPASDVNGQRPAHVGGEEVARQIERERAGGVGAPGAGLPDVGGVGEGRCQRDLVGQFCTIPSRAPPSSWTAPARVRRDNSNKPRRYRTRTDRVSGARRRPSSSRRRGWSKTARC